MSGALLKLSLNKCKNIKTKFGKCKDKTFDSSVGGIFITGVSGVSVVQNMKALNVYDKFLVLFSNAESYVSYVSFVAQGTLCYLDGSSDLSRWRP